MALFQTTHVGRSWPWVERGPHRNWSKVNTPDFVFLQRRTWKSDTGIKYSVRVDRRALLDLSLTNILVDEEIIPAEQAVRRVCPGGYWHVPTHGDHSAHDMSSIYLIKQETTSLPKIATRILHLVLRIPAFLFLLLLLLGSCNRGWFRSPGLSTARGFKITKKEQKLAVFVHDGLIDHASWT